MESSGRRLYEAKGRRGNELEAIEIERAIHDHDRPALQEQNMGRIVTSVTIQNVIEPGQSIKTDALVDTGASHMVLPNAWSDRLGSLDRIRVVELETATQEIVRADVCGPVKIQLEGFEPVYSEVIFIDMQPEDGIDGPLVGYLVLEQSQAAVDMVGHRLIHVKHLDLK